MRQLTEISLVLVLAQRLGTLCDTPVVVDFSKRNRNLLPSLGSYFRNRLTFANRQRREKPLLEVSLVQASERTAAPRKHGCLSGVFPHGFVCLFDIEVAVSLFICVED